MDWTSRAVDSFAGEEGGLLVYFQGLGDGVGFSIVLLGGLTMWREL